MHNKLFPSQLPNEKILLVVREHWFLLFSKILVVIALGILPIVLRILLGDTLQTIFNTPRGIQIVSLGMQFYYIGLLISLFVIWILYYLNIHIISEERIVDMDQIGLLNHMVSELNIETIEDVTSHTTGLFGNLLDYGTVYVQTAGATERFEFNNVANPGQVASIILEVYEQHSKKEQPKP